MRVFLLLIVFFGLYDSFPLLSAQSLEEIKKSILDSPYVFSSEMSVSSEIPLGEKVFLTNRVSRERFRVAGKPVTVFFSRSQTLELLSGLKSTYQEVSNGYLYQALTDEKGEMVLAFTPQAGWHEVDIHFVNVPKNYTEHINHVSFKVFDPAKIHRSFFIVLFLWGGVFFLALFVVLAVRYSLFDFSRDPPYYPDLFPCLSLFYLISGKNLLLRQGGMVVGGMAVALLLYVMPLFLLIVIVLGIGFFRERVFPIVLKTTLLLVFHIFLIDYLSLQSLPQYIGREEIGYLTFLTVLFTSPVLLAGMTTLIFLHQSGTPLGDLFFAVYSSDLSWEGEFSFTLLFREYLVREFFYLFLLSVVITGLFSGYRLLRSYSLTHE